MGKRLIIAEKPSVGRDIASILNCRENGNGCRIGREDIVTWAVGRLVGLCSPDEIDEKYAEWKLEDIPIFPGPFPLKVLESGWISSLTYRAIKDGFEHLKIDSEYDNLYQSARSMT